MKAFINRLTKGQMRAIAVAYVILLVAVGAVAIYEINSLEIFNVVNNVQEPSKDSLHGVTKPTVSGEMDGTLITNYVFVGDSRFVAISQKYAEIEDTFIAKVGVGCQFFVENEALIRSYDSEDTVFIVNLGVNSLLYYSPSYFAEVMNNFAQTVKGRVCYATVGPVNDAQSTAAGYGERNDAVNTWNKQVAGMFSSDIMLIDVNSYLNKIGFYTTDGIHYADTTYYSMYTYIKSYVQENI
ncbi:MAG: hypothetical protein ACI4EV_02725 [Lachnospiraceae bacterium]